MLIKDIYYLKTALKKFKMNLADAISYTNVDPFVLAEVVVKPYAIAYFSAVDYYGWCVRPPDLVYLQTPVHRAYKNTIKRGDMRVVNIGSYHFKPVTIKKEKFFGFEEVKIGGKKVLITDKEKTIIDSLDKPKYAGTMEEVLDFLRNAEFDAKKLVEYLRRFNSKTVIKRVGYISEKYGWGIENEVHSLLSARDRKSFPLFDPNGPSTGKFNYKWGLRINVPESYWRETKWM